MEIQRILLSASDVSIGEIASNERYMTVEMRMFSTRVNLNKCIVSEAFIDDIVNNAQEYIAMPQCADSRKLKAADYRGLGHMLDPMNGTYLSEMIGSFVSFRKETDEYGVSLFGTARIPKRSKKICDAVQELYEAGNLNFSFEIMAGGLEEKEGIKYIDASPDNYLTAMAVVSIPAYPEAKAIKLVAETEEDMLFENTRIQMAEVDFQTIRNRLYEAYRKYFSNDDYWSDILLLCVDCMIIYNANEGKTYKMEYRVEQDSIIITDYYEVAYTRKEGKEKMELNEAMERISQLEAEQASAKASQEAKAHEELKAELEAKLAEAQSSVETLQSEVEELKPFKAEAETLRAEKEAAALKEKQDAMKAYASANGLNTEDAVIAEAIEKVDYERLFAEVMKNTKTATQMNTVSAALWDDMGGKDKYGGLLQRA